MGIKAKIHKGKLSKCKVCMDELRKIDPEYAALTTKNAGSEDKRKKRVQND